MAITVIKVFPTEDQKQWISSEISWCRTGYNLCMSLMDDTYRDEKKLMCISELFNYFQGFLDRNPNEFIKKADMYAIFNTISYVHKSYKDFIKTQSNNKKVDPPYLLVDSEKSYATFNRVIDEKRVITFNPKTKMLFVPKLGYLKTQKNDINLSNVKMVKILENNDGNYYVILLYEISKNSSKALLFKQYLFDEVLKGLTRQEIMLISDSKGMKDAATQRILMYLKLLNESDKIKEDIIKKTLKNGDEAGDNEVDDGSKVETDK